MTITTITKAWTVPFAHLHWTMKRRHGQKLVEN